MDCRKLGLLVLFVINGIIYSQALLDETQLLSKLLPDVPTFADIAEKCGRTCEEYSVTTEDGYILKVFHIPGNSSKPVLLMHGIIESSDSFITREEKSLALTLAAEGYDVWAGNNRGNRYSRSHVELDPNTDKAFWDYSFHEMGYYDLPPIIDLVLSKTKQKKLRAVGFSEGNTIFYVLGATRPEYNDKILVAACLSPMAYLENTNGPLNPVIKLAPEFDVLLQALHYEEVLGFNSDLKSLIRLVCSIPNIGYEICMKGVLFTLVGSDPAQIGPGFAPKLFDHCLAGTSRKALIHYSQTGNRKVFGQYDYGPEQNMLIYSSRDPPNYDLTKVTMDVAMYVGANDFVSTNPDVELLIQELPNVVEYKVLDYPLWNYLDQILGKDMNTYLFPYILDLFSQYD